MDRPGKYIPESTKGFIFIGTPHMGSKLTIFGKLLSLLNYWQGSNTTLLQVVDPDSSENAALHDAFMRSHGSSKPLVNFFEVRPERFGPFPIIQVSTIAHSIMVRKH